MKKVLVALTLMFCVLSLVGCSSSNTVEWVDGTIKQGNSVYSVDEYSGNEALISNENYTIDFYICDEGPGECLHNDLNIAESDMEDFEGGSKYYAAYLDTLVVMYIPNGNSWIEGALTVTEVGTMSLTECVEKIYSIGSKLNLSIDIQKVKFNDKVILDVSNYEFKMRPEEVIIPGFMRVIVDDGSIVTEEQVGFGDVFVGKKTSSTYDYYQYDGVIVQVVRGTDISTLVTFE